MIVPSGVPALLSYLFLRPLHSDLPSLLTISLLCVTQGVVMIPGISQLTQKDLKYRLQAARVKSIITSDALAPHVDAISTDCPSLQTKLLVSDTSRPGWINFRELLR